jgi:hypothetical protein
MLHAAAFCGDKLRHRCDFWLCRRLGVAMTCSAGCGQRFDALDQFMREGTPGYTGVVFLREHTHDDVRFYPEQIVWLKDQAAATVVAMGSARYI